MDLSARAGLGTRASLGRGARKPITGGLVSPAGNRTYTLERLDIALAVAIELPLVDSRWTLTVSAVGSGDEAELLRSSGPVRRVRHPACSIERQRQVSRYEFDETPANLLGCRVESKILKPDDTDFRSIANQATGSCLRGRGPRAQGKRLSRKASGFLVRQAGGGGGPDRKVGPPFLFPAFALRASARQAHSALRASARPRASLAHQARYTGDDVPALRSSPSVSSFATSGPFSWGFRAWSSRRRFNCCRRGCSRTRSTTSIPA